MPGINFFQLREKTLTAAEKTKREEVAKAMERESPGMDKAKKMAIATATAKRVAEDTVSDYKAKGGKVTTAPYKAPRKSEKTDYSSKHIGGKGEHKSGKAANTTSPKPVGEETEQIDELHRATVKSYADKRSAQVFDAPPYPFKKKPMSARVTKNIGDGMMRALKRMKKTNEEVEQIDEISNKVVASYVKKASSSSHPNSVSNLASRAAFKLSSGNEDDGEKEDRKSFQRSKNISKAVDRLTKEDTDQIDEISSKMALNAYQAANLKAKSEPTYARLKARTAQAKRFLSKFQEKSKKERGEA